MVGGAFAVEPLAVHTAHQHQHEAEDRADPGKYRQSRSAHGGGEGAAGELQHLDKGGRCQQKLSGQKAEGRLPRLAVEEVEGAEQQSRKAHGYLALLELHPAVSGEVSGGGGADIVQPVLTGDAVHLGLFAEGVLKKLLLRVGGSAELTVHLGVVESLFAAVAGRRRLLPLGGQHSTAAAAGFLIPQGALAAGRTGAELALLVGELPLVTGGVGGAVDALAQLLVADAVIRCAAVGADHDVILKCEGLAAALTRTAIVFWHNILQ